MLSSRLRNWLSRSQQRLQDRQGLHHSAEPVPEEVPQIGLVAAIKPFGKNGVRLGWQIDEHMSLDNLSIQVKRGGEWVDFGKLQHDGRTTGFQVIKNADGGTAPAQLSFRLRSSDGDLSEGVSLKSGKLRRGTTSIFHAPAEKPDAPTNVMPTGSAAASSSRLSGAQTSDERNDECRFLWQLVSGRQGEVECLLRAPLDSAEALTRARESVTSALAFDDDLHSAAADAGESKGALFQALLEALREQGAGHAGGMDNSSKNLFAGSMVAARTYKMSLGAWARLTMRAHDLRQLVRIKVADDNDLRTARQGLELAAEYFAALVRLANLRSEAEYDLLNTIRNTAMSC